MQENPRVGLILMRDEWPGCQEAQSVIGELQSDIQDITSRFRRYFTIYGPWTVHSPESLAACIAEMRDEQLDMVVLAYQTWSDSELLPPLLAALGERPLVLWCYLPWGRLPRPASQGALLRGSGPVGAFSAMGVLRNLGADFLFTFGAPDDPRLVADLRVAGRAAQLRGWLRSARFGLLVGQAGQPKNLHVDEARLARDFGPEVRSLAAEDFYRAVSAPEPARVQAYLDVLRARFRVDPEIAPETLERVAQTALGLLDLALEQALDVLLVNSSQPELTAPYQIRPGLYPDLLGQHQVIFQPEGDLGAGLANYILHHLTGSPTMFLEIWFWDEAKNQVVGGHGGMQDPSLATPGQVWVSPDTDFCRPSGSEGAQFQMVTRPGRVTLFQVRATPEGWQAMALSGVCLEGQPWVEGYPHAIVRLDTPIAHFLNRAAEVGISQHWIMAYGSVLHEIEAFCQMMKIPVELLG